MTLQEEMYRVFADCHNKEFDKSERIRNLNWCAAPVSLDEAHIAFVNACDGYNHFSPDSVFIQLKAICAGYNVTVSPARQHSPALYLYTNNDQDAKAIFSKLEQQQSMYIDDLDLDNDTTIFMWWD